MEVTNLILAVPDTKLYPCLYFMKVPQRSSQKLPTTSPLFWLFIHCCVTINHPKLSGLKQRIIYFAYKSAVWAELGGDSLSLL